MPKNMWQGNDILQLQMHIFIEKNIENNTFQIA